MKYTELNDKIMSKAEFCIQLINGLTQEIVRCDIDIDVFSSKMFSAHKEQQKNIEGWLKQQVARKVDKAEFELAHRIATKLLADYQKLKPQKN